MLKFKQKGFTLVELLTVLAIIAAVSIFSVSSLSGYYKVEETKMVKLEITELRDRLIFHNVLDNKYDYQIYDGKMYYSKDEGTLMTDEGIIIMLVEDNHFRYYKYYGNSVKPQGYDIQDIIKEQYSDILLADTDEHRVVSINDEANKISFFYEKNDLLIVGTWDIENDEISVESYDLYDTDITMALFDGFNKKF